MNWTWPGYMQFGLHLADDFWLAGYYADLFEHGTVSITSLRSQYQRQKVRRRLTRGNHRYIDKIIIEGGVDRYEGSVGAVVNHDVKPYALMVGVPARQVGWMSEYGEQIPLPLQGQGSYTCPHTGNTYHLTGCQLIQTGATHAS